MKQRAQKPSLSSKHNSISDSRDNPGRKDGGGRKMTVRVNEEENQVGKRELVNFESLPDYMKDNEFIRDHYRCEWPLNDVALSVFSLHNETLNIWTHLIGFMIFAWLTAVSLTERATVENLLWTIFRQPGDGPLMNLTSMNINDSDAVSHGSRLFYLTSITLFGILAMVTLLAPTLSSGRFRAFRASIFLTMGFSGVIPAAHSVILYWENNPQVSLAIGYEVVMGILYAAGAGFYLSRVPERWKPGAFDIVGHSHQIFHVFVVAAALCHTAATLIIMDWRRVLPMC